LLLSRRWFLGRNFLCVGLSHNFRPLGLHLCHGCLGQRLLGHNHLIGLHLQHGCVGRRRFLGRNLYLLGLVLRMFGLNGNLLGLAITRIGIDLHVVGLDLHPGCVGRNVHLVLDLLGLMALGLNMLGLVIHRIGLGLLGVCLTVELLLQCFFPGRIPVDLLHVFWPPPQPYMLVAVLQPKVFFDVL
jgi:hypothetical protein